jgi:hypothetical protein
MRPPQAAKSVVVWGHLLFASVHMSVRACLQTLLKDRSPSLMEQCFVACLCWRPASR